VSVRVALVASSAAERSALAAVVKGAVGLRLVSCAETVPSPVERARADVFLIALAGERLDRALRRLARDPSPPTLVVIDDVQGHPLGKDWRRTGVRAVLPRDASPTEIVAAVQAAAAGLLVIHPDALGTERPNAAGAGATTSPLGGETLTPREIEVLRLLADGLGNKTIATRLGMSEHTAKFHVASILGKLGASSRTETVTLGIRRGLIII
jgi:two-component system, NarL family, response regulator YdfI